MAELYDISPPLTRDLAVFPGDTPLERRILLRLQDGDPVTLSTLTSTVHLGAHVDAASHYDPGGDGIDRTPLDRVLGRCRLCRVNRPGGGAIHAEDLERELFDLSDLPPRLLVATGSVADPRHWSPRFATLTPDSVDWMADRGVLTIGIDTPSIDPADSKDLPAHRRVAKHGMTIIEGLVLGGVPAGDYELIALPLRLVGFDGSPVRAVLRSID